MIISWNTDPSKGEFREGSRKFSSYYQFDTVSRKLVRIRLELGRDGDSGATMIIYNEDRAIGFSGIDYVKEVDDYPDEDFTIDPDSGQVLVKGVPLSTDPKVGDSVVDMSEGQTVPHFGNRVSDTAHLPAGIENKHLSVLANQAVLDGKTTILTAFDASPDELSTALQDLVGETLGKPFAEITNDDLLAKLQSQVSEIKRAEIAPSKESLANSLEDVDTLIESINTQIADEGMVPTEEFETAFRDLQEKVDAAKEASAKGSAVRDAIADLSAATASLRNAAADLQSEYNDALEAQFTKSDEALERAQSDSERWEGIEAEYEAAESATSIDEYEESIGIEETEAP